MPDCRRLAIAAAFLATGMAPADLSGAGWTFITETADAAVFMKPDARPGSAAARRVWTAYDLERPQDRDGFTFRSVQSLGEFDCTARRWRAIEETFHSEPGLKGKAFSAPSFRVTQWAAPAAGSVGEMRMDFACPKGG